MIKFNKKELVNLPKEEQTNDLVAVQLVEYTIDYYGTKVTNTLDTRIDKDGRQFFVDGDGFIDAGTELVD